MKQRLRFGAVDIGWQIDLYSNWIQQNLDDELDVKSFVKYKVSKAQYPTNYTFEVQYSDHLEIDPAAQISWVREHHAMDRYGPVLAQLWLGGDPESPGSARD